MLQGRLASLWEEFRVQLQDAVKHVTQQTPLMIQTLDNKLQVCLPISSSAAGYFSGMYLTGLLFQCYSWLDQDHKGEPWELLQLVFTDCIPFLSSHQQCHTLNLLHFSTVFLS